MFHACPSLHRRCRADCGGRRDRRQNLGAVAASFPRARLWSDVARGVRPGSARSRRPVRRRAGRTHPRRPEAARCCRRTFSISAAPCARAGSRASSGWHSRPTTRAADASTSTSRTAAGHTVVARFRRSGSAARRRRGLAIRFALGRGGPGVHRAAVRQPQRRPSGVRAGRVSLRRARRRRVRQRSGSPRAEPQGAPGQDAANRRERHRWSPCRIRRAGQQSVRQRRAGRDASGDLELRAAEPVALLVRRAVARRDRRA